MTTMKKTPSLVQTDTKTAGDLAGLTESDLLLPYGSRVCGSVDCEGVETKVQKVV